MKTKRLCTWIAAVCTLLSACLPLPACAVSSLYTATFLDAFDTVLTVQVNAPSRTEAETVIGEVHSLVLILHRSFDAYHEWADISNIKTVNDGAGNGTPVPVGEDIIRLLTDGRIFYDMSGGNVNVCLGAVTKLWREAREDGTRLPDSRALQSAAAHCAITSLTVDAQNGTVYLSDADCSLDVGAIAKGYAADRVAALVSPLIESGQIGGLLFDLGGHILALGTAPNGDAWSVGIRDPQGNVEALKNLSVMNASVVTSAVDQRTYTVNGVTYHHLIDPATLYPARECLSVTVCVPNGTAVLKDGTTLSAAFLADALSTALFILPYEDGVTLLKSIQGVEISALWVMPDGTVREHNP